MDILKLLVRESLRFVWAAVVTLLLLSGGEVIAGEAKPWQMEWESTLAAAKKEGRVAVIGPPPASHRETILEFRRAFPEIVIEHTTMATVEIETRISRERQAGQYAWDVIVGGIGPTVFSRQIPDGWFDPLKNALVLPQVLDDAKWLGGLDAGYMDKGKRYAYAFALYTSGAVYLNRDWVPESEVQKVDQILHPRWKGKIALFDPRMRGPGAFTLAHLRKVLGDEATKRLLVDQEPVVTRDTRQIAEWLVRGRYPIAIGSSTADIEGFQKEGLGLNIKRFPLPVEAVALGWGGVMLLNRAPHPNAAKVFLNWLLGPEAQSSWAKLGKVNSRRVDVPPGDPETALDPRKLDRYVNLQSEENAPLFADAIKFATALLK